MLKVHYPEENMRRWYWNAFAWQSAAESGPRTGRLPSLALCAVDAGVFWAQNTSRVWIPPPQMGPISCQWRYCCWRRETWHSFHSEVFQEYLFGVICLKEEEEEVRKTHNSTGNLSYWHQMYVITSLSSIKSLPMDKDIYQLWILNLFYFLEKKSKQSIMLIAQDQKTEWWKIWINSRDVSALKL